MKAYRLFDIHDLRYGEAKEPFPRENEVIISVKATGICGSDIPRIYHTGTYSYPLIPGHEFSGLVTQIGSSVDRGLMGKRAGVFPLVPCRECAPCRHGQYELCRNYSYLGSRENGGFAEYVRVPVWNLMELPDTVSFAGGAMLEPMAVAAHAVRRAALRPGNTAAICGLGTIGQMILMTLREAGVQNILVIGNKDLQKEMALLQGIAEQNYCDKRKSDMSQWIMDHTEGKGADVFFECVGKNETVAQAIENTAANGTVLLVGNPASDMHFDRSVYWKILRNQLTVTGTWNSSFCHKRTDDWHYVLERLADKRFSPELFISHRIPFDQLERGFETMRDKSEEYIKIMGVFERV